MAWYRCGMNGTYNATTVSRSGAVCNYVANVGGVPLAEFVANITPIQEGSGDPSPSNPRAITGWSAVHAYRSGADTTNPDTYTINLGGTYYVGTLNVLTGLFTATGLLTTYTKNSSWTRNTSGIFYTDAPSGIDDLYISNMFECYLPKGSSNALADGQCRLNVVSTYINFKATSCDTVEEFKALLGDNTIQMVYTLATPQTYQLTPAQLTQLLGENNVWADSGDSEVDFFKIIRT